MVGDSTKSSAHDGLVNWFLPYVWPHGRRFSSGVVANEVVALLSELRSNPPMIYPINHATFNLGGVISNDITYNAVFPYAATPHNGRNNSHHTQPALSVSP